MNKYPISMMNKMKKTASTIETITGYVDTGDVFIITVRQHENSTNKYTNTFPNSMKKNL